MSTRGNEEKESGGNSEQVHVGRMDKPEANKDRHSRPSTIANVWYEEETSNSVIVTWLLAL